MKEERCIRLRKEAGKRQEEDAERRSVNIEAVQVISTNVLTKTISVKIQGLHFLSLRPTVLDASYCCD